MVLNSLWQDNHLELKLVMIQGQHVAPSWAFYQPHIYHICEYEGLHPLSDCTNSTSVVEFSVLFSCVQDDLLKENCASGTKCPILKLWALTAEDIHLFHPV